MFEISRRNLDFDLKLDFFLHFKSCNFGQKKNAKKTLKNRLKMEVLILKSVQIIQKKKKKSLKDIFFFQWKERRTKLRKWYT